MEFETTKLEKLCWFTKIGQKAFVFFDVANALIRPETIRRAANARISFQPAISRAMQAVGLSPSAAVVPKENKKRGRCSTCSRDKDAKTENRCSLCNMFVCGLHAVKETVYKCIKGPHLV